MPFEVFDKKAVPTTTQPWVTIQKKGLLSLNRAAMEALGTPEAVELLYDREEQIVGIRPTSKDNPRSFPARRQGKRETANPNYLIAGQAFCNYYGIETGFARRFNPEMQEEILTVDLKKEYADATGPRTKNREGE